MSSQAGRRIGDAAAMCCGIPTLWPGIYLMSNIPVFTPWTKSDHSV